MELYLWCCLLKRKNPAAKGFCAVSTAVQMLRAALSLCVQTHTVYTKKDSGASGSWRRVCQHPCSGVERVTQPAGAVQGVLRQRQPGGQLGDLGSTANSRQVGKGGWEKHQECSACGWPLVRFQEHCRSTSSLQAPSSQCPKNLSSSWNPFASLPASADLRRVRLLLGEQNFNQNIPV